MTESFALPNPQRYPEPTLGQVMRIGEFGSKVTEPLDKLTFSNVLNPSPSTIPGLNLNEMAAQHDIFKDMQVTTGTNYGSMSNSNLSYNHTLNTCEVRNKELGALTVGDLIILRKMATDVDSKLNLDACSRLRAPPEARWMQYGAMGSVLYDSNRYFVLTPAGFNAYMASMTEDNLKNPQTHEEMSAEEVWSRWSIYGVITSLGVPSASYLGPERASQPHTLTGSEKSITVTYNGECTMRHYFPSDVGPNQSVWAIFRRTYNNDPINTVYKASPNMDKSYSPSTTATKKPFAISFYADPQGGDKPPPRSLCQYEDTKGMIRDGVVFYLGTIRYPFSDKIANPQYSTNSVLPTYKSGTVRMNLQIKSPL